MELFFVGAAAFAGAILAALLGWLGSGEDFVGRKFAASVVRAAVAATSFVVGYYVIGPVTLTDILIAFVAGAGFDVVGHRLAGIGR